MFSIKSLPSLKLPLFETSMKLNHTKSHPLKAAFRLREMVSTSSWWTYTAIYKAPVLGELPFYGGLAVPKPNKYRDAIPSESSVLDAHSCCPCLSLWFALLHVHKLPFLALLSPLSLINSGFSCQALGRSAACSTFTCVRGEFSNFYLPSSSKAEVSCGVMQPQIAETKPVFIQLVQVSAS